MPVLANTFQGVGKGIMLEASLVWYWGRWKPDPIRGGSQQKLVRCHLVLYVLPVEIFNLVAKYLSACTYMTYGCFSSVNLVVVLKNNCDKQTHRRQQFSNKHLQYDLHD